MSWKSCALGFVVISCVTGLIPAGALGASGSKAKPDLTATAVSVSGASTPGAAVTVGATVRTTKAAAAGSKLSFYLSSDATRGAGDALLASAGTPSLKTGKSTKVTAKGKLPAKAAGSYFVLACADAAGKIAEASEKNNCAASARRTIVGGGAPAPGGATPAPGGTTPGAPQIPAANPNTNSGTNPQPQPQPPTPPTPPVLPVLDMGATRNSIEGDSGTARTLEYDVTLSAASTGAVSFSWATSTATSAEPEDFVASSGDVTIPAGQTSATLSVPVIGDTDPEDDEVVRVVISNASGATLGAPPRSDATILDDEPASAVVDRGASSQTSVVVTFSAPPTNLAANGSQFTIAGLTVSAASLVGSTVTVTTSAQLANQEYTLEIDPALRAGARTVPASLDVVGLGPIAQLEITEVNANIAGNADLVELRAMTGGSLVGAAVDTGPYGGNGTHASLPSISVAQGDYILIHYGNPATFTSELASKSQCSNDPCVASAWDVAENTAMSITPKILAVTDGSGDVTDGVVFRQTAASTADAALLLNLTGLQDDGLWMFCGMAQDAHCTTSADYDSVAAIWSGTATSAADNSIRRVGADTNRASNWVIGASSWGAANP